jgi:hypothetical protein
VLDVKVIVCSVAWLFDLMPVSCQPLVAPLSTPRSGHWRCAEDGGTVSYYSAAEIVWPVIVCGERSVDTDDLSDALRGGHVIRATRSTTRPRLFRYVCSCMFTLPYLVFGAIIAIGC